MSRQYGVLPGTAVEGRITPSGSPAQRTRPSRSTSPSKPSQPSQKARRSVAGSAMDDRAPPPVPPRHRSSQPASNNNHQYTTPATAGPMFGIESDISSFEPPDSSSRALRDIDSLYNPRIPSPTPQNQGPYRSLNQTSYPPSSPPAPISPATSYMHKSQNSLTQLMPAQAPLATRTPSPERFATNTRPNLRNMEQRNSSYYHGDGYDDFDPWDIADDGEEDFPEAPQKRRSRMGFGAAAGGAGAGAGTGAAAAAGSGGGGMLESFGLRSTSAQYGALAKNEAGSHEKAVKSEWHEEQRGSRKRMKWLILAGILIVGAIVGGIVGGILGSRNRSNSGGSGSSPGSSASNNGPLYDINSKEVQKLLNNKDLHRVFPGMDYTPLNAQYPDCLHNPPDQNNITLDVAMLSQLTPAIRLYGTDCNQTEKVLTAIDKLNMNNSMTVWLGVWLGSNDTTNTRQVAQMHDILDKYPSSHFAGIIVGNEVLFRKDMPITTLGKYLTDVRSELAAKKINLPVATSDLGDNWTAGLAAVSDIIMANVHPFFAGITPDLAPGWTYNFWQTRDVALTPARTGSWPKSAVSEVGWPSDGGNDCGTDATTCAPGKGAVASIDNLNKFMDGWVCQSLTNGTTFFWFEAFDEPWKVIYNTDTDKWESKWGLIDSNRNVKPGLKIPDCGGKKIVKPY